MESSFIGKIVSFFIKEELLLSTKLSISAALHQNLVTYFYLQLFYRWNLIDLMALHHVSEVCTDQRVGNLLRMHFVNIKHIKMRRNISSRFVSLQDIQQHRPGYDTIIGQLDGNLLLILNSQKVM